MVSLTTLNSVVFVIKFAKTFFPPLVQKYIFANIVDLRKISFESLSRDMRKRNTRHIRFDTFKVLRDIFT